jgi:hypothetical protein
MSPVDPGEVRWSSGSIRIGYLGHYRWRLDGKGEVSASELCELMGRELSRAPRGEPVSIWVAGAEKRAIDLGVVSCIAPGLHRDVRVAWRDDLVGSLPARLWPIDVYSVLEANGARWHHTPFSHYLLHWLHHAAERCWGAGVPLPPDRFTDEFSAASFAAAADPAALAARLEAALIARLAVSPDPAATFGVALNELAAHGHECRWSDSDGRWETWASQHILAYRNAAPDGRGPGECGVRLVDAPDEDDGEP